MMLPLRYTTILPLMSSTVLTLTLSPAAAVAIVTMVVIMTMADTTRVKTVSSPVLAVAMVLSVMATVFGVFLHRWDYVSIRPCNCFLFALLWGLGALPKNEDEWSRSQNGL